MIAYQLIAKKRDGGRHPREEIDFLVENFTLGRISDSQMAAWLMAAYLRGLDLEETTDLTRAMIASGEVIDLSPVREPKVDKHSTGGVGDKLTLVAAPLAAAAGVRVPKLSGRALGHTGGTLDKLESIPGFRTSLTGEEFVEQVNAIGLAVAAQTAELVPADKKIYRLRDQTATVASMPFIAASILSKKMAGGANKIVIDIKNGTGAFMHDLSAARDLAGVMTVVGRSLGLLIECAISDMNQPLGRNIGNALEVAEAIECLRGRGPADLTELALDLASRMLVIGGVCADREDAMSKAGKALASGAALDKFRAMVARQGGDARIVDDVEGLPHAADHSMFRASAKGYVQIKNCMSLGLAAAWLTGHLDAGAEKHPGAGLKMLVKQGDRVDRGEPLVEIFFDDRLKMAEAEKLIDEAIEIVPEPPEVWPLLYQ